MDFKQLVEDYSAIAAHVADLEANLAAVKEVRDTVKAALLAQMNTIGIDSAKSVQGHGVCKVTNMTAKINDPAAFKAFLIESGETDLIQNRASADACLKYQEEHGVPPPGVELGSMITLRFNRSKA